MHAYYFIYQPDAKLLQISYIMFQVQNVLLQHPCLQFMIHVHNLFLPIISPADSREHEGRFSGLKTHHITFAALVVGKQISGFTLIIVNMRLAND